jgi:hypothetical protein
MAALFRSLEPSQDTLPNPFSQGSLNTLFHVEMNHGTSPPL